MYRNIHSNMFDQAKFWNTNNFLRLLTPIVMPLNETSVQHDVTNAIIVLFALPTMAKGIHLQDKIQEFCLSVYQIGTGRILARQN